MSGKKKETEAPKTRDKLWTRYWAEQGVAVIHVDRLKIKEGEDLEDRIMRVKKVFMEPKRSSEDTRNIMRGIACHWIDNENRVHEHLFHSRELIPYDVAKKGLGEVQRWLERIIDNE